MDSKTLSQIRAKLGHTAISWSPNAWLDTKKYLGNSDLNRVLGHEDYGIPFGRIIEIFGWESMGKSSLVLTLCALAQMEGAVVVLGDLENSFDSGWAIKRGCAPCPTCVGEGVIKDKNCSSCGGKDSPLCGLDVSKIVLIQPYVGIFGKEKEERLSYAQELINEMDLCLKQIPKKTKCVLVLDSIAAMLTEGESIAGIEGSTMRTDMELPKFLGRLMRRWVGSAQTHNALVILVNQLREGPSKGGFGGGAKTTGGNAPKFYAHIRAKIRRVKGSKIMDRGKQIGITGLITAVKNKSGGCENASVGFRLLRDGPMEFISAKDAQKSEINEIEDE